MKGAIVLGLLSASVSGMTVHKRQNPLNFLSMAMKKQKAFKIEEKPSDIYPGAKQMKIHYGPYKINPANQKMFQTTGFSMDPHGTGYMGQVDSDFPTDITVLRTSSYAVDENFVRTDTADGLYNHHDVFFDMGKTSKNFLACNGKPLAQMPVNILMVRFLLRGIRLTGYRVVLRNQHHHFTTATALVSSLDTMLLQTARLPSCLIWSTTRTFLAPSTLKV
jgi:hypothetical protein